MITTTSSSKRSHPLAYGFIYMGLSMAIEIALLVVFRLKIPQDNSIIAPILLIASPVCAALICGHRHGRTLVPLVLITIFLTLLLVMGFGRVTGIVPPVIIRTLAGCCAAWLVSRVVKT
jgi:hypothetical protein